MSAASESPAAPAASEARLDATGWLLLLGITLFWGTNWTAMKIAVSEMPVFVYRSICVVCGGFGLLAICRLAGLRLLPARSELRPLFLVGLANITGWYVLSGFALVYMASNRAVVIGYTMPLWTALLAVVVLGERPTRRLVAGLAAGLAGIAVLIATEWRQIAEAPIGVGLMLAAAMSWAAGTVSMKRFRWTTPLAALTGWQLVLGGAPILIAALLLDRGFDPGVVSLRGWAAVIYSSLIPIIFCQWAWFTLVNRYPAIMIAISSLATPAVGVLSGTVALGEPVGIELVAALVLVCASLGLVLVLPRARRLRFVARG